MQRLAVCLMGPTASGKTDLAIRLAEQFPVDIISVDSALVYRGMDIGTAKPDPDTLRRAPHRLVDIREPEDTYSAGNFVSDATAAINESLSHGRIPLLVGGTMMYFRALTGGLQRLPSADVSLRAAIDARAERDGWPSLHDELRRVDPETAARLNPNDSQRIQRALEVFELSGRPLSDWQKHAPSSTASCEFLKIGLFVEPRALLHARIAERLKIMIESGFADEVKTLMRRPNLTAEHASMRSVGYRQFWACLSDHQDLEEAERRTLYATRQLAKRQLTWMRSEDGLHRFDALDPETPERVVRLLDAERAR